MTLCGVFRGEFGTCSSFERRQLRPNSPERDAGAIELNRDRRGESLGCGVRWRGYRHPGRTECLWEAQQKAYRPDPPASSRQRPTQGVERKKHCLGPVRNGRFSNTHRHLARDLELHRIESEAKLTATHFRPTIRENGILRLTVAN
jgi:hypothetical protein